MRKRQEIRDTVADYLRTSPNFSDIEITKYRVYPYWREQIPAINVITGNEETEPENQTMGSTWVRTMDLVFEIYSIGDTAGDEIDEIDLEIERLISLEDNPLDSLMSDGKYTIHHIWPASFEEPEVLSEGDEPIIKTRIHYECIYVEKAGGST